MLTILASPKPFTDPHINMIQRNAIQSWMALRPNCDVILFGDEPGMAEVAAEYGLRHVPDVECNSEGLPLVRDLFSRAEVLSRFDVLAYVNADIILLSDFTKAVARVREKLASRPFLVVGQRYDLEVAEPIDSGFSSWEADLREQMAVHGELHGPEGIDYFVFTRGLWPDIPPMVIGRIAYDNWLIYRARALGVDVIDGTQAIGAIHQKHAYQKNHFYRRRQSPEALKQVRLAGSNDRLFKITDANWMLTVKGLVRPPLTVRRLKRMTQTGPVLYPRLAIGFHLLRALLSLLRRLFST